MRRGIPYGDSVPDGICFLHRELEPSAGRSGCVDEAASELYEDLSEDGGEEPYVCQSSGRQDETG